MRQRLCRRLEELERISTAKAQRTDSRVSADSAIDELREVLRANHFQQEPNESLAETFARFLGISLRELKAQFTEIADGHSRSFRMGGL
jgi:hypothetical protein